MINLEVFFRNHFDTIKIIDNKLKQFAEVHLQRMTANNPGGIYSARITATATAYNNYFGAISSEDIKFALQQGLTITMNNTLREFIKKVQQKEGTVKGNWGKDSEEYQEFFPLGLTEYDNASPLTAELLMNRMVAASTAHVADLGAPFVTLFTDLRTAYIDARTAQLAVMGQVEGLKSTAEINRNVLETELMHNLLFIALNNIGHPEMMPDYFDQSIIRSPGDTDEGNEIVIEGDLAIGQVDNIDLTNLQESPTLSFLFENPGTTLLNIYAAPTTSAPQGTGAVMNLAPAASITKTAAQLQTELGLGGANIYLNIQNNGPGNGHYKVTITE